MYPRSSYEAQKVGLQAPGRVLRMPITLPIALQDAGVRLQHLELELCDPSSMSSLAMRKSEAASLEAAMQDLKCFRFKPHDYRGGDGWVERNASAADMRHVESFLRAIINTGSLEWMDLRLDSYYPRDDVPLFEMGKLMSLRTWPKLYGFGVHGIPFRLADIKGFIDQLQEYRCPIFTLDGHLLDGTWEGALDILREKAHRHWRLDNPRGAECEQMSPVTIETIFKGNDLPLDSSLAEKYIRSKATWNRIANPIRAYLDQPDSQG